MSAKMTSFWLRTSETVLLVLAFMLPLAFFLRTYDVTAIKTTLFEAGTLVLAFAWLFKGLERGRWELPEAARSLALPALALLAWTTLRFALSPYKLAALPAFLKEILCIVTYLIALLEFGGAANARRLFGWATGAAWLAALYGLAQRFGLDPFPWKGAFGGSVFSTFGEPGFFGLFLALCVPLALTQWLDPERDRYLRRADLMLLALLAADAFWTDSAASLYAFTAMSGLAAVCLPLFLRTKDSFKAGAIAVILAGLGAGFNGGGGAWDGVRSFAASLGWVGAGLGVWLSAALAAAAWEARQRFLKQGAVGESCYLAGLCAAAAGFVACAPFGMLSQAPLPGWFLWPLAGMLGGLTALSRRSAYISVLPLPLSQAARQRLYAPALLAFAGLAFFPLQWFDSEIEHNIALARANARDWDGAVAHFDKVRPGAESYVAAQYGKGGALLAAEKPADAIAAFSLLQSLSPDHERVHLQMAQAYAQLEDWKNAVASHERQAELDPSLAANYAGWAQAAKRLGDLDAAEAAAKKAIALEPNDPAHQTALAEIYMKERRVGEAHRMEKQAVQLKRELKKKPQG